MIGLMLYSTTSSNQVFNSLQFLLEKSEEEQSRSSKIQEVPNSPIFDGIVSERIFSNFLLDALARTFTSSKSLTTQSSGLGNDAKFPFITARTSEALKLGDSEAVKFAKNSGNKSK